MAPLDPLGRKNPNEAYEQRQNDIKKMHKLEEKKQTKGLTNEEEVTLKNLQAEHADASSDPKVKHGRSIWEGFNEHQNDINKFGIRIVPKGGTSSQEKLPTMEEAIENAMRTFGRISELLQKPKGEQDQ